MANVIEKADAQIASFLSDWSIVTTLIALTIVAFVAYPIIYAAEPDTHPLLLARQSSINPVRRKYESAVYRSPEVPVDTPLRTGLNVKAPGAPRWAAGKDGDLRDVWREVQKGGSTAQDGKEVPRGLVMTVLGKEEIVEHQIEGLSGEIRIIGEHLRSNGCKRLAVYLPNSVEYLSTVFGNDIAVCEFLRCVHADMMRSLFVLQSHAHTTSLQSPASQGVRDPQYNIGGLSNMCSWEPAPRRCHAGV